MKHIALVITFTALTGCGVILSDTSARDTNHALTLRVRNAPPPDRADPRDHPSASGSDSVWIHGYWDYLEGVYIWREGHWVENKPGYEYVRAHYEYDGTSWVLHRPRWTKKENRAVASGVSGG